MFKDGKLQWDETRRIGHGGNFEFTVTRTGDDEQRPGVYINGDRVEATYYRDGEIIINGPLHKGTTISMDIPGARWEARALRFVPGRLIRFGPEDLRP